MTSPTTSPTPRTILGTDYVLDALAAEGLGHLFMVPGGLVDPFLPALARQGKLKPVIAAHEGGAVYMADGYARASGRFGAALGIGGPGCCNMATAVAAAKTDGSPVLVMTGEVPLDLEDRGTFQDAGQATLDDTTVMAPLTRLSKTVATAKNLNHWFRHALTTMWAQPRGPVHLSLTHDALAGESAADYVAVSGFFAHAWRLSTEAAETALRLLADKARGRIAASPSSPAMAACRCTASRCRPRRATDCRSSTWSSTIPPSATSGCARGNTARCRRSSPAFPITIGRDLRARSGRKASPCASPRSSRARSTRRWPPPPPRSSTSRPTRIV